MSLSDRGMGEDVKAIVKGHHFLPHERWYCSHKFAKQYEMEKSQSIEPDQMKGPIGIVLQCAGRASAVPGYIIGMLGIVLVLSLRNVAEHRTLVLVVCEFLLGLGCTLIFYGVVRIEQSARAARVFQEEMARTNDALLPAPPPTSTPPSDRRSS